MWSVPGWRADAGGRPRPRAHLGVLTAIVVLLSVLGMRVGPARAYGEPVGDESVTLSGSLSVRGGASPVGGTVRVSTVDRVPGRAWTTEADADGQWQVRTAPGALAVTASSTFGMGASWPDLPLVLVNAITTVAGETRTGLDVSMRARPEKDAFDEFGDRVDGYAPDHAVAWEDRLTLPRDDHRSVTVQRGAQIRVGVPQQYQREVLPPPGRFETAPGEMLYIQTVVENTGDDVLWLDDPRFEGPDAGILGCDTTFMPASIPTVTRAKAVDPAVRTCANHYVLPGDRVWLTTHGMTTTDQASWHTTLVLGTNAPGGDVRIPFDVVRVATARAAPNPWALLLSSLRPETGKPALGRRPAAARRPAMPRVRVARRRVSASFTAPGTLTLVIESRSQRAAKAKATWSIVQRTRLTARRAGTRTARISALRAGRYRVRATLRTAAGTTRRTVSYARVGAR